MAQPIDLTDLQLDIMRVLWAAGEASAAQVTQAMRDRRDLAFTTVATLLTRLEKKGVVSHRSEGRVYIYRPEISEEAVRRSMLSRVSQVFHGDVAALISQLLSDRDIGAAEITRLEEMIEEHKRQLKRGNDAE